MLHKYKPLEKLYIKQQKEKAMNDKMITTENKFLLRGVVQKTYTREFTTKLGGKYTQHCIVLNLGPDNLAQVQYKEPQAVNAKDEVEARGFIKTFYKEANDMYFTNLIGQSLTLLKAYEKPKPINAPLPKAHTYAEDESPF